MATPDHDIGVAMPVHNAARWVEQAVTSALTQTGVCVRIAAFDDGSTDASFDVLRRVAENEPRLILDRGPNGGVAAARRRALALLDPQPDLVLFLDADDVLEPRMLCALAQALAANPSAGIALSGFSTIDEHGQPIQARVPPWRPGRGDQARVLPQPPADGVVTLLDVLSEAPVIPSVSLMRRSVLDTTPGWDVTFGQPFEDMNLMLNMALKAQIVYVDQPLVRYRQHSSQSTGSGRRVEQQRQRLHGRWRAPQDHLSAAEAAAVERAYLDLDRRVVTTALAHAARHLRRGHPVTAARIVAGAPRLGLSVLRRSVADRSARS